MHGYKPFGGLKLRLSIGQGETVVGTHVLADVATIHPAVEDRWVVWVEGAFIFDGEIGDTFSRIDVERGFQSPRGAGVEAFGAASATVG